MEFYEIQIEKRNFTIFYRIHERKISQTYKILLGKQFKELQFVSLIS